jgi:hypothetical protein
MNRQDFLTRAGALISGDRHDAYGDFADTAECLAGLWSAYLHGRAESAPARLIEPRDIGPMLALLKIMRLRHGGHQDSSVDACGYLALGGELDSHD